MRYFLIVMTILVIAVVSCNGRKGWWRRTRKSVSIKPEVGAGGKWGIKGSLTITFRRKRDTTAPNQGKFNVELMLDPCELMSYDTNGDGSVKQEDIENIFEETPLAKIFFEDADANEDGQLSTVEFSDFSRYINGCDRENK